MIKSHSPLPGMREGDTFKNENLLYKKESYALLLGRKDKNNS